MAGGLGREGRERNVQESMMLGVGERDEATDGGTKGGVGLQGNQ